MIENVAIYAASFRFKIFKMKKTVGRFIQIQLTKCSDFFQKYNAFVIKMDHLKLKFYKNSK